MPSECSLILRVISTRYLSNCSLLVTDSFPRGMWAARCPTSEGSGLQRAAVWMQGCRLLRAQAAEGRQRRRGPGLQLSSARSSAACPAACKHSRRWQSRGTCCPPPSCPTSARRRPSSLTRRLLPQPPTRTTSPCLCAHNRLTHTPLSPHASLPEIGNVERDHACPGRGQLVHVGAIGLATPPQWT